MSCGPTPPPARSSHDLTEDHSHAGLVTGRTKAVERTVSEPAFEDMLTKLRRALVAARFSGTTPNLPDPNIIRDYQLACAAAAA